MEKVKVYLNPSYFGHPKMSGVLNWAFGMTFEESKRIMQRGVGLNLICTTDQLARFRIYRRMYDMKDESIDLNENLAMPEPDVYQMVADVVGITRDQAEQVSIALWRSGTDEANQQVKSGHQVYPEMDFSESR